MTTDKRLPLKIQTLLNVRNKNKNLPKFRGYLMYFIGIFKLWKKYYFGF